MKIFYLLLLFFPLTSFSMLPAYWNSLLRIEDKHEFYRENQVIKKPIETWQLLFSIVYPGADATLLKDCVFYYVPKKDEGKIKIKSIQVDEKCEKYLFEKGDLIHQSIKSLQYSFSPELNFFITKKDFKTLNWKAFKTLMPEIISPKPLLSSAEFQSGKLMLLSPKKGFSRQDFFKKKNEICHKIDDDCNEVSPPDCELCEDGWYEIPNGCSRSPKYCGIHFCGQKDRPACSKGTAYLSGKVDCAIDNSFAFCQEGLKVSCENGKVFCR